ncbi:response regulator receiver modulated diguanylate cyclase/phosphodiesterase with PAS/PAC sensor(s) [Crinalium epipsammum PCC 9333]|uniref:Response regulator receiver modulated diguanylate cyclase/phosphodiesterase with PAS/PAC sensor(S) n=1 Tax=Crinalium epipsammum PCC 9333 TaxID=1173022 RepID=K9W5P9_9CYAN|nr:EAL domain-containing protein [Crinalium epipsammum]AFZ15109.1 response regulator receiver modulated diguanylate cyclase/phosphodiesterase with PAS/PAC sensor(s) [Crinalium epipsammum PCC 9333]
MNKSFTSSVKRKILIVDDTPDNLRLLDKTLTNQGYEVQCAINGELALIGAGAEVPDLILLDIKMPGLDGYQVCQRLKAQAQTCEIPVIFLSALDEAIDKVKAFTVGGVDYITKPFQIEEVLARVENQLALQAAKKEITLLNAELEQRINQRTEQLKRANVELTESEEQFRLTFEMAPIGIAIQTLDGKFIRVNKAFCETSGYPSEELLEKTWMDISHPDDIAVALAYHQKLYQGEISDFQIESRHLTKDGKVVYGILQVAVVRDAEQKPVHLISQFLDISARKLAEEKLIFGALHDDLTNLPNRNLLMERLELALKQAQRQTDYLFAVMFIDLDRFKIVNDSLGHDVGDQLLVAIARKLETLIRATDIVARLGGDEFIILLDHLQDINDAIRIAERICLELNSPFLIENRQVFTTASIGIVLSSPYYQAASELLRDADIAMYRAKEAGKARYEIFDRVMHAHAVNQLQLESDLRDAIAHQELLVNYQPIISLTTGKLTGFEALLRWEHPSRGFVSPAEFIPIAEETGLIITIGEWILREACRQLHTWQLQHQLSNSLTISVNLSSKQLREPTLIKKIEQIINETKLNSSCLKLELTESMLIDNIEAVISTMSQLRGKEIHLSIDDFGTGFSCLSYLHRFPINTLKIDRSFVNRIGEENENLGIVKTIITLAHELGMDAIAEGVETQQQVNQLKALGCDQAQGYFFSKPLSGESAELFIATHKI